jgi:hypothetical protein
MVDDTDTTEPDEEGLIWVEDPFGVRALWMDKFQHIENLYSAEQWARVKDVVKNDVGVDADTAEFIGIPLKEALEWELRGFKYRCEVARLFPPMERGKMMKALKAAINMGDRYHRMLQGQTPHENLPALGGDSSQLQAEIDRYEAGLKARLAALEVGLELPPEWKEHPALDHVFQKVQSPGKDPLRKYLLLRICVIFEQAFGRPCASTEDGPTANFLRAAAAPEFPSLLSVHRLITEHLASENATPADQLREQQARR